MKMMKHFGSPSSVRAAVFGLVGAALLVAQPARAQDKPVQAKPADDTTLDVGLGLTPGTPQVGSLPGGITPSYGQKAADEQDYRFDYHGLLT
ncbi:MAG TPA: hypothetical protein VGP93_03035, partial [Polyangiaceae bacterium]|nr:hypothetical protein [Polyangiaceae bacterium]